MSAALWVYVAQEELHLFTVGPLRSLISFCYLREYFGKVFYFGVDFQHYICV